MKTAFIVQARFGSTRLPRKIIRPFFEDKTILDLLIDKLKTFEDIDIIIATSSNSENDIIESIAKKHGVKCYRGDENDVLNRFICSARYNNCERIIRICSDNPFIERKSLQKLIEKINCCSSFDYIGFRIDNKPSITTHYGFWGEYVSLGALEKVASLTNEALYREHVTNYIYTNPDKFNINWIDINNSNLSNNIRLTIDTETDFMLCKEVYKQVENGNHYSTIDEIVEYLRSNEDLFEIMTGEIEKNEK